MDEIENIIEKYRRELIEFSKSSPYRESAAQTESDKESRRTAAPAAAEADNCIDKAETEDEAEDYIIDNGQEFNGYTEAAEQPQEDYIAPKFDSYEDFIKANSGSGTLRFQVFAADRAFPIQSARVSVVLELKNGARELFDGLTDTNGIIDAVTLPAPEAEMSLSPSQSPVLPYSSYTAYIGHPEFVSEKIINIPVFSGIKSIQDVEMIPLVAVGGEPSQIEENEGESFIRLKGDD